MSRTIPNPKPPMVGPRGGAGDSGTMSLPEAIMAEAARLRGDAGPRQIGAMMESVRDIHRVVVTRPGGIHALLCRLGLHAWTQRFEGTHYVMLKLRDRCACGAVRRG